MQPVGWEHSMKYELIIAQFKNLPRKAALERLQQALETFGLQGMSERFGLPRFYRVTQ